MIAYEKLLYTGSPLDINKELAIARWLHSTIGELNRKFTLDAMDEWNREGDFRVYLELYIKFRWVKHCISN